MEEYYLRDIWRIQNPEAREYSWFKTGNLNKASRIDFALVSGGLDQYIENSIYISALFTDHRAMYMVVDPSQVERGRGFWKLNTQLLKEEKYIQLINSEIKQTLKACSEKRPKQKMGKNKTKSQKENQ